MSSNVRLSHTLAQIAVDGKDGLVDGPFGSNLPERLYTPSGVPVIRGSNLSKGKERFKDVEFVYVSEETATKLSRSLCLPDDIVFTKKGTLGQIGYVPSDQHPYYLLSSNQMRMRVNRKIASPEFVYYYLAQPASIEKIIRDSEHTGVPKINLAYLREFPIWLPNLSTQFEIVSILRSLDDRMALLRETNATLEGITQASFKSWFVDFDPVRAKQRGLIPEGMNEATAALFPQNFEESELGAVPKGWRVLPVGEVVDAVGGATPDTKDASYWEPGEHCWTTPKDLSGLSTPILLKTERKISNKGLAKIGSGLLPAGTLLLSSRAPIGYLALAQVPVAVNQGYIAILPNGRLSPLHMLHWCRQNMEVIKARANGSTFMEISKKAFRPIPCLVPTPDLLSAFDSHAGALFERIIENEKQLASLVEIRDALLPRLISGQLRIADVEDALDSSEAP